MRGIGRPCQATVELLPCNDITRLLAHPNPMLAHISAVAEAWVRWARGCHVPTSMYSSCLVHLLLPGAT